MALAFGSVSVSWLVTPLVLAPHDADDICAPDDDGDPATLQPGGLRFPDDDARTVGTPSTS